MTPHRVLHLIAQMGVGGAEAVVAELAQGGSRLGWQTAVASAGGIRATRLESAGLAVNFPVSLMQRRRPSSILRAGRDLRRVLASYEPDVVVAHNVGVTALAALVGITTRGLPLVSVFHGVAERDNSFAAQVLDRGPHALVTVSSALNRQLHEAGMRRTDVRVIPNAVSAPDLPDRGRARSELGLNGDIPVALCLGRMVAQKRHDILLRAWAQVPGDAILLLAGDGNLRDAHERLAVELGVDDRVQFLGDRDDVPRLLSAADVVTLASDWEGQPIALLEAMAAGRPVVATAVGGLSEIVRSGEGTLVPPNDPWALADCLSSYLYDAAQRQMRGNAARLGVLDRHSPARMLDAYAEALSHATNRASEDKYLQVLRRK